MVATPLVASVAVSVAETSVTYQPFAPCVPERLTELTGGLKSTAMVRAEAGDVCGIVVEDVVPLRQRDWACVGCPVSTVDLNIRGRDAAPGVVRREAHDDVRDVPSVRPGGPRDRRGRRGRAPVDGHRCGM